MGCSIEKGSALKDFFYLRDSIRAKKNKAIIFPIDNEYTLKFRKPVSSDFPILINIPKLVKEVTEINTDSILSVSDNE